jgi:glycosyltransferase involved in cell wall biosynthesis
VSFVLDIIDKTFKPEDITRPFSLCMMSLNEASTVVQAFDTISRQTVRPSELIIFDSASEDGTFDLIKRLVWEGTLAGVEVQLLSGPRGPSKARNKTIAEAKNDIVVTLDFGCQYATDLLMNLVGPMMDADPPEISFGITYPIVKNEWSRYFTPNYRDEAYLRQHFLPSTRNFCSTKQFIQEVGGFPEWLDQWGDDTLFDLKAKLLSHRWVLNRSAVVQWHAPVTREQAVKLAYGYGYGDGENGFGDYRWNGQTRPNDPVLAAVYDGIQAGRVTRRTKLAEGRMQSEELYPFGQKQ